MLRHPCAICVAFSAAGNQKLNTKGRTNLLPVLAQLRCGHLLHLSLHHGSFQALIQVSITIHLKRILTKGFDLGKTIAWITERIQNP